MVYFIIFGGWFIKMKFYIFNETNENLKNEMKQMKKLFRYAVKKEHVENAEFNIIFVDKEKIHEINREYRGIDKQTDVISFALEDVESIGVEQRVLGDIYICVEKARGQAEEYGHSFLREVCFLAVHGFYHLLGYDHMEKEDEKVMFQKQEELLEEFGIRR